MYRKFSVLIIASAFIFSCHSSSAVKVRQAVVAGDPATPVDARNFDICIIHTNDVCGFVNDEYRNEEVMDLSTFAGFVSAVRKSNEYTLVVDAGNFTYGTEVAAMNKGRDIIGAAKLAGYNCMNIGDQDLRYGVGALQDNVEYARQQEKTLKDEKHKGDIYFVSQNVRKGSANVTDKFKIFNLNGFKIGVVGLVTPNVEFENNKADIKGLKFKIDIKDLQRDINSVKRVVDYLILLANVGVGDEIEGYTTIENLVKQLKNIDLVIDGHSQTALKDPLKIPGAGDDKKEITVVQAGSHFSNVGLVQFTVAEGKIDGEPIFTLLSAADIKNPQGSAALRQFNILEKQDSDRVKNYVASMQDKIDVEDGKPIAFLPFPLDGSKSTVSTSQSDLGYIISESFMKDVGAEIGIFPNGLIRNGLNAGETTKQDAYKALPCTEKIVRLSLTGNQIWDALEYAFSSLPAISGRYPQTNLVIEYAADGPVGEKIKAISMQDGTVIERNIEPYTVAVVESMLTGIEGYTHFQDKNAVLGGSAVDAFAKHLSEVYPLY